MKGLYWCLIFSLFCFSTNVIFAQTNYRSLGGFWDNASSWEIESTPGVWTAAVVAPTSTDGTITISALTTVDIRTNVDADQLIVESDATLNVKTGSLLRIFDGTGTDLTVSVGDGFETFDGFLNVEASATLENRGQTDTGPTLSIFGKYIHNQAGGLIANATWQDLSETEIQGITTTKPTGLGQSFYKFVWNSSTQTTSVSLQGELIQIRNDFVIQNTGTGAVNLTSSTGASGTLLVGGKIQILNNAGLGIGINTFTLDITGDLEINSSRSPAFNGTATNGNITVNVGGSLIKSNTGSVQLTSTGSSASPASSTAVLDIAGDLTWNTGTLTMAAGTKTGTTAVGTVNVGGNLTINGGSFTESSSSTNSKGEVRFDGSVSHQFSSSVSSPFSNTVNFVVANPSVLNIDANSFFTGLGSFTLQAGATLGVASPDGLATGSSSGNIRVSGTRSYVANSNIIYNGSVAQNLGDEWSSSGALNGVAVNLEIANNSTAGVTNNIIGSTSLVGILTLTTGSLNIGNSNTLEVQNNFIRTNGTVGGDPTSNLTFSGSGSLSSLVFKAGTEFINNLVVSRATELVLGSDVTVSGNIDLSGGNLNFSGRTLTMNGSSISTNGTGLRSTASTSNLVLGGSTFTGTIPFAGTGNQLNKLTFGTNGGSYTWNSSVVVNDSVKLTLGALTNSSGLTMANNADFVKGGGTISGASPVVSGTDRYNVTYTGTGVTGVELPASTTILNNLTISSSGTVTLSVSVTVNGNLTLSNGTFDSNAFGIEVIGNFTGNSTSDFAGTNITFSGPSSTISGSSVSFDDLTITGTVTVNASPQWNITGDLVNNGSLSVISGTANFAGTTTISGSSTCNFRSVRIEGTLNAPAQMNVAGSFQYVNGAVFNANGGTVNFTGTPSTLSNVASVNFHHILISSELTSSPTLNLTGNFTDNGVFTHGTGTVRFVGSSPQQIGGSSLTDFNNISITNTAGPPAVQVVSNKNLRGVLTLSAGTEFDPDGPSGTVVFRLRSTGDVFSSGVINDAAIATLPAGASVNGNVTVERYMALEGANNNRIYRFISSPVRDAPVSQLIDNFKISGTFTGKNQAGSQSMFGYNESVITDQNGNGLDVNDGYFDFPANDVSETMNNGRGYAIFVYGNETPYTTNGNALWDVRGTINSGEINFNSFTTLTTSADPSTDGWNLVGNPYPSTIDWDAASGWTKTGIANAIYMRDNGVSSPIYATYINGDGVNGGSRYIPIGQAFQVRATGTPIDFRATEAVKVAGQQATYFRQRSYEKIRIALEDGTLRDEMLIRFTDQATDGFDPDWDAYKFQNYKLNLSSQTIINENFAINSLPSLTCGKTVRLSVTDVAAGKYSLSFTEFETLPADIGIELFDSFTGVTLDVRDESYYSFEVTEELASFGHHRFELRFKTKDIPDFVAFGEDVCESKEAVITVSDSKTDVRYRIMKNGTSLSDWQFGTGGDLQVALAGSALQPGENLLSVQASAAGCESSFLDKAVEFQVVPLSAIEQVTNGSHCGPGLVTVSASGVSDGNYKWYETETDEVPIAGAVNSTFTTPELAKTKTYYVSAINAMGCESARKLVVAEIVYFEVPVISLNVDGKILTSSYESGNQWYFNGAIIPGATGRSIEATETGLYEVGVSISGCSARASQEMIVLGSEGGLTNGISFYPNPVADVMYIQMPTNQPASAVITSTSGQPVGTAKFSYTATHAVGEFDFSTHAAGVYIIKVLQGNSIVHYKILKK